ncbi:unnamed protein product [Rotaria magnacalcarata]|uniref:B box-type domain-containing protein n=2 Tax=Rotaria magnacalcarata TaxID=392030 RepID=A0A816WJQ2_9BILA|nr:unnamed protein product [Rotaria magnacalcarata]CAF2135429.1 unnamed protein product [Rotaria magnacalcarata]
MMATAMKNTATKDMCDMCSPKQVIAIMSCKGCLKDMCRKHFNEHRDKLSTDIYNVSDLRDNILQELQIAIDRASKSPHTGTALQLSKQIDEWKTKTIERVSQAAKEAHASVECLFSRKLEYDQVQQKVDQITNELKEQQESESFVETDIDHWMKQLKQLKSDLNRPSQVETNPPVLQIQSIDWKSIIAISTSNENYDKLSQNLFEQGILYSLSINYSQTALRLQ